MSPRRKSTRRVSSPPILKGFKPIGLPCGDTNTVIVRYEEFEALRLADYKNMTQEEAAQLMNISRPTFTRIYGSCLKKIAEAFTEGKTIVFEGGNVEFDKQWYRCNECYSVFHESEPDQLKCSNCNTDNVEHINERLANWGQREQKFKKEKLEGEFCVCQTCDYKEPHYKGVPCYSKVCPNCNTPLTRERKE